MKKLFFLLNKKENEILIKSISQVLKNINISLKKTKEHLILTIICDSCELFIDKIKGCKQKYIYLNLFLLNSIKQIQYLESQKHSYYLLNPKYIYIINDEITFIIDENINEIINKEIKIINIFEKKLCSPELYKINTIPNNINYKSVYFSISLFLLKNLIDIEDNIFYKLKEEESIEKKIYLLIKIDNWLNEIKYSKMYWFIKKNLSINEKSRNLVYI